MSKLIQELTKVGVSLALPSSDLLHLVETKERENVEKERLVREDQLLVNIKPLVRIRSSTKKYKNNKQGKRAGTRRKFFKCEKLFKKYKYSILELCQCRPATTYSQEACVQHGLHCFARIKAW